MKDIALVTLNARYIHASLGLRYLYANMQELQHRTRMQEFTINQQPAEIVEQLLAVDTHILGFGVYIWNVSQTTEVMRLLRILRQEIHLVVGGPEVSHEIEQQEITRLADHVITGAADKTFSQLCRDILEGIRPGKLISSLPVPLGELASPYPYYDDNDIANRVLYVEASRGCPFKCEFCLSSLDKSAEAFDLDAFFEDMQNLIDRGAQQFKFVDRTFNLKVDTSRRILEFFLAQTDKNLFLHFELIPDRLPDVLMELLPKFPPNSLQFEIGIQSFNVDVQSRISRRQKHDKTCDNLRWLRRFTHAHIHADLIFGLPGEDLVSFGEGFDLLYALGPQEIQVGMLKRLRGTPITRHTVEFDMRFMSSPPYRILSHRDADFDTVQRMVRFARYWDLAGNSGRFPKTLQLLLGEQAFGKFLEFSDWLYRTSGQTHRIALPRWFQLFWVYLRDERQLDTDLVRQCLMHDFRHNNLKGMPGFALQECEHGSVVDDPSPKKPLRQARHL